MMRHCRVCGKPGTPGVPQNAAVQAKRLWQRDRRLLIYLQALGLLGAPSKLSAITSSWALPNARRTYVIVTEVGWQLRARHLASKTTSRAFAEIR